MIMMETLIETEEEMTARIDGHQDKSLSSKETRSSLKSPAKHKKTGTISHRKVNIAKGTSMKAKPKLKPSKSDLSDIEQQQRKISTFSAESDRMRNLSSSDGMLVVRKRSVWSRLNDPISACDDDGRPPEPQQSTGEVVKKRKHGIVPFIPSFRSDIMSVFKNANTRRKNRDAQNDSSKHSPPKDSLLRKAVRRSDIERVQKLLTTNKDININATNNRGITALHEAAIDGNCPILQLLIKFGADINIEDNEGYNALDYAVCGGDFECASFLVNNGASETRVRNGLIGFAT